MRLAKTKTEKSLPVTLVNTPLEQKCVDKGVRITSARRIILNVLELAKEHLTAEDVYRNAMNANTGISISTIYSNIRGLVKVGIIERRRFRSKHTFYSAEHPESHDQVIHIESGEVVEFRNEALAKLKLEIAKEYGFDAPNCRVEFYVRPNKNTFSNNKLN